MEEPRFDKRGTKSAGVGFHQLVLWIIHDHFVDEVIRFVNGSHPSMDA
jgi:hypothetical protein